MAITNCRDCGHVIDSGTKSCNNCGAMSSGLLTLTREKMLLGSFIKWNISKNGEIIGTLSIDQNVEIETDQDFLLEVTADYNGFQMSGSTQIQKGETKTVMVKPGPWGIFKFLEQ